MNDGSGNVEVIDVFGNADTVDTGSGGDDAAVDMNSATEGDARSMASEGGDADGGTGADRTDADGRGTRSDARGDRTARARPAGARGGDADDDDVSSFSRRTQSRIRRERALVNRERALREQVQQQLTDERAARVAQDERIAALERTSSEITANADVKSLEAQILALTPQIAKLIEDGNTLEAVKLQSKLGDLQSDLKLLKYDLTQKQNAANLDRTRQRQESRQTANTTAVVNPEVADLVNQFQKANRHWWNRTANREAKEDAITIDKEILVEITAGELDFEPYSDEHFEEIASRLHESYPGLEIQDLEGQPYEFGDTDEDDMTDTQGRRNGGNNARQQGGRQNKGRGAAPVRNMGQGGRKGPNEVEMARQGRVVLDDDDRATMRTFKMDPNDPVAKKYFAREKARSIVTGARHSGGNR